MMVEVKIIEMGLCEGVNIVWRKMVFAVFIIAAVVFWFVKKPKKESKESYV